MNIKNLIKFLESDNKHKSVISYNADQYNKKELQELAIYLEIPIRNNKHEGKLNLKKQDELRLEINKKLLEKYTEEFNLY